MPQPLFILEIPRVEILVLSAILYFYIRTSNELESGKFVGFNVVLPPSTKVF